MTTDRPPSGSYGRITTGTAPRSTSQPDPGSTDPTETAMRAARRRWATGVAILTTRDINEPPNLRGATVSAFSVVSLAPPLVLACLERDTTSVRSGQSSGVFAISILDRGHEFLADRFAGLGPLPDHRFTGVPHTLATTGSPILDGSLAWFDCRLTATHDGGDHLILLGDVLALSLGEDSDDPLLTYEGTYRRLEGA